MEKQRWEESEKKREEEKRSEKRKSQRIEDAGAWKGSKVAIHCILQWFVAPEGRKVGSPKRRAQSHLARWDEQLHAVVAQSTFRSQNVESTVPWRSHTTTTQRRHGSNCSCCPKPSWMRHRAGAKNITRLWRPTHWTAWPDGTKGSGWLCGPAGTLHPNPGARAVLRNSGGNLPQG